MDSERDRAFDISPVAVTDPDAAWLLREYFAELAGGTTVAPACRAKSRPQWRSRRAAICVHPPV